MYKNKRRSSNEKQLGDVIEKLLKAYNLDDKMKELDLVEAWPELMGKLLHTAQKAFKSKIKNYFSQLIHQ